MTAEPEATIESRMNPEYLVKLYREMLRIRLVEEEIAARYAEQEMRCPVHLSIGQEAAVGACERDGRQGRPDGGQLIAARVSAAGDTQEASRLPSRSPSGRMRQFGRFDNLL